MQWDNVNGDRFLQAMFCNKIQLSKSAIIKIIVSESLFLHCDYAYYIQAYKFEKKVSFWSFEKFVQVMFIAVCLDFEIKKNV